MDIADLVVVLVLILSAVVAVVSIISTVYIIGIYRQRHEQSLFLARLVSRDIRVGIASAVILVYLALAMLELTPGRPWGSLIISLCVVAMMVGPADDALLWFRERRRIDGDVLSARLDKMDRRMDASDERENA